MSERSAGRSDERGSDPLSSGDRDHPGRLTIHELDALEPVVDAPGSRSIWLHLLTGPVIWIGHFMVVYLVGEEVCQRVRTDPAGRGWGESELTGFVVVATAVTAVLCVAMAAVSWRALPRDADGDREPIGPDNRLTAAGIGLSLGSALTVLAVGLPVIWVGPC